MRFSPSSEPSISSETSMTHSRPETGEPEPAKWAGTVAPRSSRPRSEGLSNFRRPGFRCAAPQEIVKPVSNEKREAHGARISLMGVPIDALTEKQVVDQIIADWRDGHGGWVVTPNLDQLRILYGRPDLKKSIAAEATLLLADGMPLVWASKLQGTPLPGRVAGSELIWSLTAAAAAVGASIFLLGGNPGVGEKAAELMTSANPRLKIAGILSPPMGFEKDPEMVAAIKERIAAARPDLVYSCFGFPKQEWMIQQLQELLPGSWFLGLGGSLSMIAGEFRQAPVWMRRSGLEWVCRLGQEPRRLFTRYIVHDAPFAVRLLGNAVWHRWAAENPLSHPQPIDSDIRAGESARQVCKDNGARLPDAETRGRILNRYASMSSGARWLRVAARVKQFAWFSLLWAGGIAKRLIDIAGALILIIGLSPLLLIFALLVKISSRGPLLFSQTRVGEQGQLFKMYKFRSMRADAESLKNGLLEDNEIAGGVTFKIKEDPRRTRIGKFMRQWSIDELPQLWNVLRGNMSLVGPRPPLPEEVQQYTLAQRRRLDAIPGLTCIWQVSGRCEIPFERQVELDTAYIESHSLSLDFKLLVRTVSAVLRRRGAY